MRRGLVTVLDVGSSKVSCIIVQIHSDGSFEVLGMGHHLSSGMKSGVVINMAEVITSIVNAVHTAEKMAGITVQDVIASVNGAHFKSLNFAVELNVEGHPIDEADIRRSLLQARETKDDSSFHALHIIPIGYALDGVRGIRDPRGMYGNRLRVSIHTLQGKASAIYNLSTCVARSHLEIVGTVAAPYASGLACLVDDERELGVILIDMGGGTTSFSVFHEGQLRHTECIPLGGGHVTMDIARCLSTTLVHAERLKTLYGSATSSASDDREMIAIPLIGERRGEGMNQMPRSALVSVIKPRIEEIFEQVRDRLLKSGVGSLGGRRVVLTGGASQLGGVREVASLILGKSVRLGKPFLLSPSELSQNPAFSTCIGLLAYGQAEHLAHLQGAPQRHFLSKVGDFLKKIW